MRGHRRERTESVDVGLCCFAQCASVQMRYRVNAMNLVWVVVALAVLAGIVTVVGWSQRSRQESDLGIVSHQWLAEHRHSQTQDSHR